MNYFYNLAEAAAAGNVPGREDLERLVSVPSARTFDLFPGADMLRRKFFGSKVSLCTITNAKSGRCTEDCAFCAQSSRHGQAKTYPLKSRAELAATGRTVSGTPIKRFSMVTSGRGLLSEEVQLIAGAVRDLGPENVETCASLGILRPPDFEVLKKAGLNRYHHNLETAPGFFPGICTTHGIEQRMETVRAARRAGLSVCSGGVFGIGETDAQVIELALTLRELDVDAVPVNFLVPIPGTPLENMAGLTPLRCLKIICLMRYILADKEIIICGGRMENLAELHPLVFMAGASGIMTGNYLTRKGRSMDEDLKMIRDLGLEPG